MKRVKFAFLLAFAFQLLQPGAAQAERFLVKNPVGTLTAGKVIRSLRFGNENWVVVESTPQRSDLKAYLMKQAEAVTEEARIVIPKELSSRRPLSEDAWHVRAMHYDQLPKSRDGLGIVVAVLDTGMDYNHPALKDHLWANPNDCFSDRVDHDHNGFANDCHGWDFDGNRNDPMDTVGHGTHCAGIIASSPDRDTGAEGVAQGVKIMPVRIVGNNQMGFISNAAAAIKYAVDNGAKILSNSWRIYKSWENYNPTDPNIQMLRSAIQYAADHGALFVAAAGNESLNMDTGFENDPMFPGGFQGMENLVVVAASDRSGEPASFTNYGVKYVTVAAPGEDIVSTILGGQYTSMSGTSMATPLVAGSLARGLSSAFAGTQVVDRLVKTSDSNGAWTGKVRSGGVIDLTKYLGN